MSLHSRTARCTSVLLVVMAFWLSSPDLLATEAESHPNFVIIMVDDMGYGDAGCYGGTDFPTPNIDRLAAEGMKFTDFHSSGCVCSPTRAGLLTGRYQQRAGIPGVIYAPFSRNRHHGLQLHEITFAEVLRDAGYVTAMFGKWHLGYESQYNPIHQGFGRYAGYVSGNVDFHSHIDGAGVFDWWHQNQLNRETGYTTHLITEHACDFIDSCVQSRDKPFCLYVAHEAPHDPYQGPADKPVREEGTANLIYNHREPAHAQRAYAEMIVEMDKGVGEVLNAIRRGGVEQNTFVMFFSDNGATGPGSCGGLYGMKGTLWEGGHRVPAVARWPGRIKAGTVTAQLGCTIDVMPTLMEFAQVSVPRNHHLDGQSLGPTLLGKPDHGDRQVFWEYGDAVSMRDGRWKLILHGGRKSKQNSRFLPNIDWNRPDDGRHQLALFDLDADRDEKNNLAGDHPVRVARMMGQITAWKREVGEGATVQPEKADER